MIEKYGNLPFGQVYKLLVSIIGRDAALTMAEEHGIPIIEKDLDRMFDERDMSLARLRPSDEAGAMELVRKFFQSLENQYGFPPNVRLLIITAFFGVYRNALRALNPYEKQTKDMALHLLDWFLGHLSIPARDSESQEIYIVSKDSVKELLRATYGIIFDKIIEKTAKNKDEFYKQLGCFYQNKFPDSEKQPDFKQTIRRYYKGTTAITWRTLKTILEFANSNGEKELIHRLIGLYLLKNTETALKNVCGIDQKDIYQTKQDILKWANDELPSSPQSESQCFLMTAGKYNPSDLSILQRDFINPDFQEQITAIQECDACLWGNTALETDAAERLIQILEEKCPNCGIFFASWARARLAVLSCKFDGSEEDKNFHKKALENYHTAFHKGRTFAGAYFKAFLEESIAATVYFNRRRIQDIPKVIDPDNSLKTPITDDIKENEEKNREASYGAKQYYEYGYALNLFEQESSKTYFLHFNAEEHFWKVFPAQLFVNSDVVSKKAVKDLLKAKGIYNLEGGKNGPEEYKEILMQKLNNVSEKTINKRMEIQPDHNIQYTPLSIALRYGELDIAEHYLGCFANSLDVTVINTHGSTVLSEALSRYKVYLFYGREDQEIKRLKKIIIELIERSPADSLYAETVRRYISVLEEAINTFDMEIVRAIVEKKGFDIQDRIISSDDFSPLYYVINRCYILSKAISKGKIAIPDNANINWPKANFPGIFIEDKMEYHENIKSNPLFNSIDIEKIISYEKFGKPEIWEQEFMQLKEIVKYLIEKTDDVDKFVKENPTGDRTTALSLAVESDFDDICRLLIEKGANPARIFENNGIPYDSPFIRAVWFKSGKTLEMLLTDFRDQIKPIINERYREDRHTAAHLLFKVDYGPLYQYSVNTENIKLVENFIPLFRSAGAEFDIPDKSGITVKKILRGYNLEGL